MLDILLAFLITIVLVGMFFVLISVIIHLITRKEFPEYQTSRDHRERLFAKYLGEIKNGDFSHLNNAQTLAFWSPRKRLQLRNFKKLGREARFAKEMLDLLNNQYKSFISTSTYKMAFKKKEKMKSLQDILYQRKSKIGNYSWDTEWDALLSDYNPEYPDSEEFAN